MLFRSTWVAGGNAPVRDIFGHNASCADDHVVSDMYAGADYGIAAEPYVIPDGYFLAVFISGTAGNGVDGMACRIDCHIWSHLAVVADFNAGDVQQGTVIVGKKVFTDFDMFSIVAVKGRIDKSAFRFPEQFFDDLSDSVKIGTVHKIQLLQKLSAYNLLLENTVV